MIREKNDVWSVTRQLDESEIWKLIRNVEEESNFKYFFHSLYVNDYITLIK